MSKPQDIELLEALFVGDDVESTDLVRAMRHGGDDASFRDAYDALVFADRELGGDFEAHVGEAMFLDALDDLLANEATDQQPTSSQQPVISLADHRPARPTPMYVAAAALLAIGLAAVIQAELREPGEFQARSAAAVAESKYETPNFEVFCVERDGGEVSFRGRNESEFATASCTTDEELKFAVRNRDPRLKHVAFFGVAETGTLYWYGPSPAAPDSIAIETSDELKPIGETIRLGVNHEPGTVRVVGLFTERPTDWSRVRTFVAQHPMKLRDQALTVPDGIVVRQTLEVSEP